MIKFGEENKSEGTNTISFDTQTDKKFSELFVGKIEDETNFTTLMNALSIEFEKKYKNVKDISGITSCICNYDYYSSLNNTTTNIPQEYMPDTYGTMLLSCEPWVNNDIRSASIEVVNQALKLSRYADYLEQYKTELTKKHNICCSVNYYHDRTGAVGFHQDSFGRELFVLLIYLPEHVHGPEWKLKKPEQFRTRMDYITQNGLMPTCFIEDAQALYKLVSETNQGEVKWVKSVQGPGGIVGFVDELMIHSTPYMEHREPNGALLLQILDEIEKQVDPQALTFLRTAIHKISLSEKNHYITIDELQPIIDLIENKELEQAVTDALTKLYKRLGEYEQFGQGGDFVLGASNHDIYKGSMTSETEKIYEHTGSRKRSLSEALPINTTGNSVSRRSFLRVWVTALPK